MRNVFILLILLASIFLMPLDLAAQCTINSTTPTEFCNECVDANGVTTGNITFLIGGTSSFTIPLTCGLNTVTLGSSAGMITINLNNDDLTIPSGVKIGGLLNFEGDGNAIVNAGGIQFSANGSIGGTFAELEASVAACLADPPPGGCTFASALPVELTYFKAAPKNDMVELQWSTATELNNDFFEVEHSLDGVVFRQVGKVAGNGTVNETIDYRFVHRQPANGNNYYRLKQVDFDGAYEYSPVEVAVVDQRSPGVQVFPNPTIDRATIVLGDRPANVKFSLSNLLGQQLELLPTEGDYGWDINLSTLAAGIYILRVEYNGKVLTHRLVKE